VASVSPGTEVVVTPSAVVVVVTPLAVVVVTPLAVDVVTPSADVVDVVDGVVDVVDEESVGALALAGITEVTPTANTVRRTVAFRVITRALIFMMHILLKRNR
jgi:hypothetical protein